MNEFEEKAAVIKSGRSVIVGGETVSTLEHLQKIYEHGEPQNAYVLPATATTAQQAQPVDQAHLIEALNANTEATNKRNELTEKQTAAVEQLTAALKASAKAAPKTPAKAETEGQAEQNQQP